MADVAEIDEEAGSIADDGDCYVHCGMDLLIASATVEVVNGISRGIGVYDDGARGYEDSGDDAYPER